MVGNLMTIIEGGMHKTILAWAQEYGGDGRAFNRSNFGST
jgi:hypothetical protein